MQKSIFKISMITTVLVTSFFIWSGPIWPAENAGPTISELSEADKSDEAQFFAFLDAVARGDLKAIEHHLERHPKDINREADYPWPPNALMAADRNIEIVKLLIEYGADAGRAFGGGAGYSSPLLQAIGYSESEPEGGFEFDSEAGATREPDGKFEFFKLLFHSIDSNGCVDTYPALEYTLINSDSDNKKYAIYMLENNACVSHTFTGGWSTFGEALNNDVELAKMMIPKIYVNSSDHNGNYPLHYAVRHGDKSVVAMLLVHDICLNPVDADGKTPLDYADPYKTVECLDLDMGKSCPEEWEDPKIEGFVFKEGITGCNCSEEELHAISQREEIVQMLQKRYAVYGDQYCNGE